MSYIKRSFCETTNSGVKRNEGLVRPEANVEWHAVFKMEVGPPGASYRRGFQTTLCCERLRANCSERQGKGLTSIKSGKDKGDERK